MTGKLVRDGVPTLMKESGIAFEAQALDDADYRAALRHKLVEEAQEALRAGSDLELLEELADVVEVVLALAKAMGLQAANVEVARQAKRAKRGGFEGRVFTVTDGDPSPPQW